MKTLETLAVMSGYSISEDATVAFAANQMALNGVPALVVIRDSAITGLVTAKSLLGIEPTRPVADCPMVVVKKVLHKNDSLLRAWGLIEEAKVGVLPLVDEEERIIGLVMKQDILEYLLTGQFSIFSAFSSTVQGGCLVGATDCAEEVHAMREAAQILGCELLSAADLGEVKNLVERRQVDLVVLGSRIGGVAGLDAIDSFRTLVTGSPDWALVVEEPNPSKSRSLPGPLKLGQVHIIQRKEMTRGITKIFRSHRLQGDVARVRGNLLLLAQAVAATRTGITITDPTGTILYSNPADAKMHGFFQHELAGRDVGVFAAPGTRKPLDEQAIRKLRSGFRESWNQRKDGSIFPVRLSSAPVLDDSGDLLGIVTVCEDITKERAARKALEDAQEHIRQIVDVTSDGLLLVDAEGTIKTANRAATELFGRAKEQIIGKTIDSFLSDNANGNLDFGSFHQGQAVANEEILVTRPDGSVRHCLVTVSAFFDNDEHATRYVYAVKDVTDLRRLNTLTANLNLAENTAFIFSGIRHEIGNPLNTIKTTAHLIKSRAGNIVPEKLEEYASWILEESRRIEYLLTSLKTFSLFDRLEMVDTDLSAFLDGFVRLIQRDGQETGITIRRTGTTEPLCARIDHRALHLALLNLVTNAKQALKGRPNPVIVLSLARHQDHLIRLTIEDNGPGIPSEYLDKIFKPFFTTKRNGSGLGLAIVHKILSSMQATIEVTCRAREGTRFSIYFEHHKEDRP